ncbi:uncharacterized protein F5891DRAFT_20488 [Suillus fuscotomentosus]|uniref:Secreted protein n=1 Tax=Suillus fuscotomentosus TaxID=1912939 RepID=A0AAD4EKX0_9AGAM|nr:uncharacterized protein F5891DRAFT_346215 [Suillus fuscotomentosus]XP_041234163.1 uncharacterized protein F5891DRAFT_20488 [Suillus fuscotomentosus]KAG1906874.1 hypothetical protein F5891DRAFT_346215 [Suillus fuscotomentosus]KAG1908588.1 hypothetical protein F5891DRAFT_20488 [Suillus fuscotomentosus]
MLILPLFFGFLLASLAVGGVATRFDVLLTQVAISCPLRAHFVDGLCAGRDLDGKNRREHSKCCEGGNSRIETNINHLACVLQPLETPPSILQHGL